VLLALIAGGCATSLRRFPLAEPVWVDDDTRAFGPRPASWYSPYVWDGADNSTFRQMSGVFRFELHRDALNVNALDEVPDSSWYTNRLSRRALEPHAIAYGACEDEDPSIPGVDDDIHGRLTITRGKPDGSNPGFFVRDEAGRMYMMKPDGELQRERPSASDAIGAAVYHAAGYFTPCNRVVYIQRENLVLDPSAEVRRTDGFRGPLTPELVENIVRQAGVAPDGRLRFSLSRFVEGQPISPWTYEGVWQDDRNDVFPHEHRRDVRAMYVLSSWLSHIDSRQENTMASWIPADDTRGHVRHYMIDFSDTLGILFHWAALARRFGYSGYFDPQHMIEDFLTFGLVDRPWYHVEFGPAGAELGYFNVEHYVPDQWRPGYPNPAYERMTEQDAAWMARIVARFSDDAIRALVERGRFTNPAVADELFRVLRGRRDRILERWLTRLSPLTDPVRDASSRRVCLEDRAVTSGIRDAARRRYEARAYVGDRLDDVPMGAPTIVEGRVCVDVPRTDGSSARPSYLVLDVVARTEGGETTAPLRIHAYDLGGTDVRVVGLERPGGQGRPSP
jgi:hypothetical protein